MLKYLVHKSEMKLNNVLTDLGIGVRLNLNSVKQLIFVMVKCGVLFEVRTTFRRASSSKG
jgi:hypothetical protein